MDWIEQKLSEWRKVQGDLVAIDGAADIIFDQFWDEITEIAREAERRAISVQTNGLPHHRTVIMTQSRIGARMERDRKLTVDLAEDRRSVITNSDAGNKTFAIEVCSDGVVCLKYQSHQISIRDAAKEVMEDFLFKGQSPFSSRV